MLMKRIFDIVFSIIGIIIFSPILIIISILIKIDSKGPIIFKQKRMGKNMKEFYIYKFRTMFTHADKNLLLTVGNNDNRITKIGYWLRKFKIDELPQLFNVLKGDMSFVGPRPEVEKYVKFYTEEEKRIFALKPGITDYSSIHFRNENELLKDKENPEEFYIKNLLPLKLKMNLEYLDDNSVGKDIKIIFKTFIYIFK